MMPAKNILFIMCDQLRYDYLGCSGHPTLKTPNIDAMASRVAHGLSLHIGDADFVIRFLQVYGDFHHQEREEDEGELDHRLPAFAVPTSAS